MCKIQPFISRNYALEEVDGHNLTPTDVTGYDGDYVPGHVIIKHATDVTFVRFYMNHNRYVIK